MNATMYQPLNQSNDSISMCKELTNDTQSSRNKHFIMPTYAVCFSVIKSCMLFYEKCSVDREGKMPSNITVYDPEIKIKYSHLINYIYAIPCPTGPR